MFVGALLAVTVIPVQGYHLPGADEPLPVGYAPVVPVPGHVDVAVPQDTPEVARAKAEHLEAVRRASAQAATPWTLSDSASAGATAGSTWSSPGSRYSAVPVTSWAAAQQQAAAGPADTLEVAAEKAKHLAAVEEAKRRLTSQQGVPEAAAPVQDTPEVAAARAEHLAAVAAAEARNAASPPGQILTRVHASHLAHAGYRPQTTSLDAHYYSNPAPAIPFQAVRRPVAVAAYSPSVAPPYQPPTPQYLAPAPAPAPAPVPAGNRVSYVSNNIEDDGQYHEDDGQYREHDGQYREHDEPSSGEYSYSYTDGLSSKTESRTADGITRGSYSYYDANGLLQTLSYEADDVNGFRVFGSNVPQVSPALAAALGNPDDLSAASAAASAGAIQDTPEVAAAKQAHFAAYREALQRLQEANQSTL